VGHVARTGKVRSACTILIGNMKGRGHLEDLGVD
jgi:hypothetical protein